MFGSAYWWEGEMTQENKSPESLLKTMRDNKVEMVDLRFTDIPGLWQHFSVPPRALDHDAITHGVGFDGSSIRFLKCRPWLRSARSAIPSPAKAIAATPVTSRRRRKPS